jgi:hypothetical protein
VAFTTASLTRWLRVFIAAPSRNAIPDHLATPPRLFDVQPISLRQRPSFVADIAATFSSRVSIGSELLTRIGVEELTTL